VNSRKISRLDRILHELDEALRTVSAPAPRPTRPSPAAEHEVRELESKQAQHVAGLMRVNHAGEVCAQGLYRGQALTARQASTKAAMACAAEEEIDHLAWCEQRLSELHSEPSRLNPLWYTLSFVLGAGAGALSDRLSLGFVAATEEQVCQHLQSHLEKLPVEDGKSRAILEQMVADEQHHATRALEEGAIPLPEPVKRAMSVAARAMTYTSYRV